MKRVILAALIGMALAMCALADPVPIPTVTTIPASGDVDGGPGAVVGWGFGLTYAASSDWVLLTGTEFIGSEVNGAYVDYLSLASAPLYIAGPAPESSNVSQAWDESLQLGLGEFDINATAPPETDISGDIVIHYSVFDVDPNDPSFDPGSDTVVTDATVSDAVNVLVTPEPASWILLIGAALVPVLFSRRRQFPERP